MTGIPERVRWAVELLDVQPDDQILEIGGGNGVAAALVCDKLGGEGALTFVDRSPVAIERATRRNEAASRAGTFNAIRSEIADAQLPTDAYDKIFAVNVNTFWTGDAAHDLKTIRDALQLEGLLLVVYDTPSPERRAEVEPIVMTNLVRSGFSPALVDGAESRFAVLARTRMRPVS